MKTLFERFDMAKAPVRTRWYLHPLTLLLSLPTVMLHHNKLKKIGMKGIKPPYVLLCNHNAFMDFKVATKAIFPHRANYVVAIDGFIGREWLLRNVGCICKRKFTNDVMLIRQLARTIENGDCVDLNTLEDTWYIYPKGKNFSVTKFALATEELWKKQKGL